MVKDGDVHGDGVNVAARLEKLAEPGTVLISRTVFDHAKGKLAASFEDLGEQTLKNIAEPVRVYRASKGSEVTKTSAIPNALSKFRQFATIAAVIIALIAATGVTLWLKPWEALEKPVSVQINTNPFPEKPSIAVLPFDNMSGDAAQESFADGISEDLTTQLSKVSGLFVISRTTAFQYKGRSVDIRKLAKDLGVRYIVEGSVRRGGDQIRINAQLIDATTGGHLWADTFDGPADEIFALQDRINGAIVASLKVRLTGEEKIHVVDRGTENVRAYDAFLRGERLRKFSNKRVFEEALREYDEAIKLDPNFASAYSGRGHIILDRSLYSEYAHNQMKDWQRARVLANQALKLGRVSLGHLLLARLFLYQKFDHTQAENEVRRALAIDPNEAEASALIAEIQLYTDRYNEAIQYLQKAMRLNPGFPQRYRFLIGQAKFHQGDFRSALDAMAKFCETASMLAYYRSCKLNEASANAHIGQISKARSIIKIYANRNLASLETMVVMQFPFKNRTPREALITGIRLAREQ